MKKRRRKKEEGRRKKEEGRNMQDARNKNSIIEEMKDGASLF
jgi:hypothetical protein